MAYCPNCSATITDKEVLCPECGYDFPLDKRPARDRIDFIYSEFAGVLLSLGAFVAACWALLSIFGLIIMVLSFDFRLQSMIAVFASLFMSTALFITFLRATDIKPDP